VRLGEAGVGLGRARQGANPFITCYECLRKEEIVFAIAVAVSDEGEDG
jgi:hypothetical protein